MRWQSILATTAIASALAGYILFMRDDSDGLTDIPAPAQPGYYLREATITESGPDGKPRMRLQAAAISQNLSDDSISLQQVSVTYRSNDQRTWLLTADKGLMQGTADQLEFSGNVHLRPQQRADGKTTAPQIRTETLSIDNKQNIARAPGAVQLVYGDQQLSAVGMKFDFARQILQLESNVNGQFR